jgi:predicted transcriptional regulator
MQIPSHAELERFFGSERATDVRFVEAVFSWASLRVLDYLSSEGPATTGEISRAVNMDMRDVKDRLEVLEEFEVVSTDGDHWHTTSEELRVTLTQTEGVAIEYTTGVAESVSDETQDGLLARISRLLSPFRSR